jgi:hypothetical protein
VPTIWIDQANSKLHARRDASRMMKSALRLWLHHRVLPVDRDQVVASHGVHAGVVNASADRAA